MPRLRTSTRFKLAYVGLAAVDTWLSTRERPLARTTRYVAKPLLMPTLAASLASDEQAVHSPLRTTTLLAQAGGWGGDVALLGEGTKPFVAGAGSFALGHVAYLTGFLRHRGTERLGENNAARGVAAAWALSAPPMAFLAGRQHRELGLPVFGYATFLAAMVACANRLDPSLPASSRRCTAAGAGLFMLSDTLLGLRKFAMTDSPPALEAGVMATYTAAQLLLSEGAARA